MFNYQSLNEQQVLDGVKKYGPAQGAKKIIDQEYENAKKSIETGVYISFWNDEKKSECSRLGSKSKCYCGHLLENHMDKYFAKRQNTSCYNCSCTQFRFIFTRPEECGMYWLPRRKDFKVLSWRAPCKCKHTHEEHNVNLPMKCQLCQCYGFDSNFACISCDQRWEHHVVLYETEQERKQAKKPIRDNYLPLAQNQEIQQIVFNKEYPDNEPFMRKRPPSNPRIMPQQQQQQLQLKSSMVGNKPGLQMKSSSVQPNKQNQSYSQIDGNQQIFPVNSQAKIQQQQYKAVGQQFEKKLTIGNASMASTNNDSVQQSQQQIYEQQQNQYSQFQKPPTEKKQYLKKTVNNQIKYPVMERAKQTRLSQTSAGKQKTSFFK